MQETIYQIEYLSRYLHLKHLGGKLMSKMSLTNNLIINTFRRLEGILWGENYIQLKLTVFVG